MPECRGQETPVGKQTMKLNKVHGRRKRERPKKRWIDCMKEDVRKKWIEEREAYNRTR